MRECPRTTSDAALRRKIPCSRKSCEWWLEEQDKCSIRAIAEGLQDISNELRKLRGALRRQGGCRR